MKVYKVLPIIALGLVMVNCKSKENVFTINDTAIKSQYTQKESLPLEVNNPENDKIDSIVFYMNNKKFTSLKGAVKGNASLASTKFGVYSLKSETYSDNEKFVDSTEVEVVSDIEPKLLSYTLVNTYPHDVEAYTEGLEFYDGVLYEGTGNGEGPSGKRGVSSLRKIDYKTGEVLQRVEYPQSVFGEGITILNGKIYQLTYKNNEAYVYDLKTLAKEKTIPYYEAMEGWGMMNDGKNIYYNDGSNMIHIVDPESFKQVDDLHVYSKATALDYINELELVNGKIYSNVYQKDALVVIDLKSGAVEGIVNLADLKKKVTQLIDTDVLNGIAYNTATKTFFVTGKNWDKLFEIRIEEMH
jgi:glutamine cyclotransferase